MAPSHEVNGLDTSPIGKHDVEQSEIHDKDLLKTSSKRDVDHLTKLSEEELVIEKKLVRRIDILIMPLLVLIYLMNYIDRNNYAAARLQGLQEDLGMSNPDYQLGLSILFVGYVLMQVPSNLLLNYCGRPALYLGLFTVAWGLTSALTSQVRSTGSIIACRFILGIVEAPFFAGVLFYLSKWYTKSELNLRMSIFYSGSLISGAFGNLIAAGILNGLAGKRGITAWQWLYIIEGALTVFFGIITIFVLPDFPDTWRALSPEMKAIANRRMALDAAEADVDEAGGMSQIRGMKLAFMDPKTWLLAVMYHGVTGCAGFQNFFPSLTKSLYPDSGGNTVNVRALLLVAPPYLFMVFWSYGHGVLSDRLRHRFWFYMYPVPVVVVGLFVYMYTDSFGAKYFSLFLLIFVFAMNGTIYAWMANSIPRPPAKRAAALAFINSVGNAASIWTPFTYDNRDSHYRVAMYINLALILIAAAGGFVLAWVLRRENARFAELENEDFQLSPKALARLQKTADMEGIDIAAARRLQKGYRYII